MEKYDYFFLKPIKGVIKPAGVEVTYYEQVLVSDAHDYPSALMHIDNFSNMGGDDVYFRLKKGETLAVRVTLEILED